MSKVRALAFDLVTHPPSEEEQRRRRRAEGRRAGLIAGLNGEVLNPTSASALAPTPTGLQGDEDTID